MSRSSGKKAIVDAGRLSGPEKAAVVLLRLGEEHISLWQALDDRLVLGRRHVPSRRTDVPNLPGRAPGRQPAQRSRASRTLRQDEPNPFAPG